MAMKKGGLGKGLEALFAENAVEGQGKTVSLRLLDIEPNRDQPRKQFDDDALHELSESIAQHGVLQPLLVRPLTGGGYQLVAGERRWRAARLAGLDEVPVVVREMTDREAAELAMIENLQREDLNPMEEARGYQALMETYGMTQEQAAHAVNKSRPAVANALRLLSLPAPVAALVGEGRLSAGHARAVLSFDGEEAQLAAASSAVEEGLSVRELEKRAKAARTVRTADRTEQGPGWTGAFQRDSFYHEVELSLTEQLSRRIKVVEKGEGGTLQIEFYDRDDLQALANALSPERAE
ncbi:MAG: ParB/RepB/Spo0J family partition protein [Clostridiales bacterium]|jgi:ParB family chromosome partitioning protein|nr:ParB/RepB/Spo0J family partition protein [Clostridiales bacterium]